MKIERLVQRVSKPVWLGCGFVLLGAVAWLDYITGVELSFSLFYLLPISLITWTLSERPGLIFAFLSAGIWVTVDIVSDTRAPSVFPYLWNAIVRLGFFLLPVYMIRLQKVLEREKLLARTDHLTGALNSRSFHELAQMEIDRSARYNHPFTVAFIDVDNFKAINDTLGHAMGDTALQTIALNIQQHMRKTDLVARIGGDEFVVLLPETNQAAAPAVVTAMRNRLMQSMEAHNWPVSFSIGVLTLTDPHISVDEMLNQADKLMYIVKNGSKNDMLFSVYPTEADAN